MSVAWFTRRSRLTEYFQSRLSAAHGDHRRKAEHLNCMQANAQNLLAAF